MKNKNFKGLIIRDRLISGRAQRWWNYQTDRLRALGDARIDGSQFWDVIQKLKKKYNPFNQKEL
jgi:hypothetical protein